MINDIFRQLPGIFMFAFTFSPVMLRAPTHISHQVYDIPMPDVPFPFSWISQRPRRHSLSSAFSTISYGQTAKANNYYCLKKVPPHNGVSLPSGNMGLPILMYILPGRTVKEPFGSMDLDPVIPERLHGEAVFR